VKYLFELRPYKLPVFLTEGDVSQEDFANHGINSNKLFKEAGKFPPKNIALRRLAWHFVWPQPQTKPYSMVKVLRGEFSCLQPHLLPRYLLTNDLARYTDAMNAHIGSAATFAHPARNIDALRIERGMTIADFGAGSGHYALECALRLAGTGRVYAIDVQRDLLRRLINEAMKRGLKNLETITGDVEKSHGTHLADGVVDLVLMSNVLFQLEHPKGAFAESWRVLKPIGKLCVIDWSASYGGMGPIKQHVIEKKSALELAAEGGFELVKEFEAGENHYGLLFRPQLHQKL
jgi:ubiquinone/menaquinone biosynthesis C-methylase UbiE